MPQQFLISGQSNSPEAAGPIGSRLEDAQVGFVEPAPRFGNGPTWGSPLGGSYATPMGAAIHRVKEAAHPELVYEPFDHKQWMISPKGISHARERFDGKAAHYRNWRSRVLGHLRGNLSWGRVLERVEQQQSPLAREIVVAHHWC